jgi:hypothetical protein
MADLTDKELALVFSAIDADYDGLVDWVTRLAIEVKRHRSAIAADRERVRAVVRKSVHDALCIHDNDSIQLADWTEMGDGVATRAADQLAMPAVKLTEEERGSLLRIRKIIDCFNTSKHRTEDLALLDRLLGAN